MDSFRQFITISVILGVIFHLSGCMAPYALSIDERPNCQTTVEGYYETPGSWTREAPALLLRDDDTFRIVKGEIVRTLDDEVLFDSKRIGDNRYAWDEVQALIDSNKQVLYGTIPESYLQYRHLVFYFLPVDSVNEQPQKLLIKPNQPFALCVQPGKYILKSMQFIDEQKNMDQAVEVPRLQVNIAPDTANYLGHIFLDPQKSVEPIYAIPYEILSRPGGAAMAGVMGGAIGGALYAASLASQGVIGVHQLAFEIREGFKPLSERPMRISPMQELR